MEISFIIIVSISIFVSFILDRIFKNKRYIKYIPTMIMLSFMVYYFIAMKSASNESFESLGKFVMALFFFIASLSSFGYSIIADIIYKKRKRK